jgi:hypothetical protein
MEVIVQII